MPLKSGATKTSVVLLKATIRLTACTYMDTCRQNEDVTAPVASHPWAAQSGWPPLVLVDGSCCSCPYLVWKYSSTLEPWRSHRHIPATIDLDGTQDSHPELVYNPVQHTISCFLCLYRNRVWFAFENIFFISQKISSTLQKMSLLFVYDHSVLFQPAEDIFLLFPHACIISRIIKKHQRLSVATRALCQQTVSKPCYSMSALIGFRSE